ncbi:hypothetical protein GH810_08510 [Acetobacterium paludosum]|uniref:Uncharacterized protein n=1 Tax=Acetobacterium paludosum TaxID=52693 RepID=A0A923KWD8_9FIRM|nr:hypothetical protein [Acetobacterium paludosum]MBC3888350.1 hypothetical protein [Acetobacterium paludosum]
MKHCSDCGQNVIPTKKFSIVWFLINCLWLVGGIVYIVYYFAFKKKTCPLCGCSSFEPEHVDGIGLITRGVQKLSKEAK